MSLDARQCTQSAHGGWGSGVEGGGGRGGGGGLQHQHLGLKVITVLCTRNNWSQQCGCRMERLALPHHRCSPFSGQNPPIKSKQVAKRSPLPHAPSPWGEDGRERPSSIYAPVKGSPGVREKTDGLERSPGRGFLRSPREVTSGNAPDPHIQYLPQAFDFVGDTANGNIPPRTHPRRKQTTKQQRQKKLPCLVERWWQRGGRVQLPVKNRNFWFKGALLQWEETSSFFFLFPPNPFTYLWEESLTANWLPPLSKRKNIISEIDTSSITEPIFPKVFTEEQFPDAEGKQTATEMRSVWGEIR